MATPKAIDAPRTARGVLSGGEAALATSGGREGSSWSVRLGGKLGLLLRAGAAIVLLHAMGFLRADRHAIGGLFLAAVAIAVVFGPWLLKLGRSLSFEREARIREQERAEVAAHLHDSVLQTLALIQTRSADAAQVAALARRQERELRRWLLARPGSSAHVSMKSLLQDAASAVEELHGARVEVVVVGDGRLDGRMEAVVHAAREALTNAAKFAGSSHVDLYAEIGSERAEVFVRDRGVGFDPRSIPSDRRGVRESMIGRMERNGGSCTIRSTAGQGTEVELTMGRNG